VKGEKEPNQDASVCGKIAMTDVRDERMHQRVKRITANCR